MKETTKAHIGMFAASLIYGVSFIVAKEIMGDSYIKPFGLILLRVIAAFTLFYILDSFVGKDKIEKKDYKHLLVGGFFGVALNMLFFFKGLDMTTPIHGALIMTTTPILVFIIAILMKQEKLKWRKTIGIILGAIGAILLISQQSNMIVLYARNTMLGDIFILINALSYGFYLVIIKKMTKKYHPFTVIKWVFFFGLIMVFPFGIKEVMEIDWSRFTLNLWLALGFILVFTSFLTYLFNIFALTHLNATTVSGYIYLQPFFASLIAVMSHKEELTLLKIASGVMIFMGVYLILYKTMTTKSISTD